MFVGVVPEKVWVQISEIRSVSSLFGQSRLCSSRNLLQNKVVFLLVDTKLDDGIPIFSREIVLVHTFYNLVDSALQSDKSGFRSNHFIVKQYSLLRPRSRAWQYVGRGQASMTVGSRAYHQILSVASESVRRLAVDSVYFVWNFDRATCQTRR